jgi:RNA polymerase sigma factor (sigma-70 family)
MIDPSSTPNPPGDIAALRSGDRQALQDICSRAMPHLERAARTLMGDSLRARYRTSDLVQSALVEAISQLSEFRGTDEGEFVRWTQRILTNNIRDRRRFLAMAKRATGREEEVDLATLLRRDQAPVAALEDREQLWLAAQAIRRLPKDQQRVLHLVVLRGLSHKAAATTLARSEEACRALLARARAALIVEVTRLQQELRQRDV